MPDPDIPDPDIPDPDIPVVAVFKHQLSFILLAKINAFFKGAATEHTLYICQGYAPACNFGLHNTCLSLKTPGYINVTPKSLILYVFGNTLLSPERRLAVNSFASIPLK